MIHLLLTLLLTLSALAGPQGKLGDEIAARRARVPEFVFIADEAKKLGVRAWLFGGTAAGYAHYVKWDLARESGDERYQKDRFDYDYTNIYRSTQDLDIVIDGPPEKAEALEKLLREKFPHFQGKKSAWEVRLLRDQRGDKESPLNNPNYLNQHTDSNSTGMIELTEGTKNEPVVRDLLDWDSRDPYFLRDVREGKLHYYFSPLHESTNRAKAGLNPPIESAIRYLTKAFQYELELRPEDLAKVREVVDAFDPANVSPEVKNWIEKNGKKLFQHAVNLEYARETVDRLGLAAKLGKLNGNAPALDSLAWWMEKEPLRSHPVGTGEGKTAAQIFAERGFPTGENGALVLAHETNNFLAYESITRAHTGDPNVLISRSGEAGEMAAVGDGFYTQVGRKGARHTGLTIRFTLDPAAREGTDFLAPEGIGNNFIVVKNKRAIRVIPESLNWTLPDYFRFLASNEGFDHSDKAILEKLKRRIAARSALVSPAELEEAARIVTAAEREAFSPILLDEWLAHPGSLSHSEELFRVMSEERPMGLHLLRALRLDPTWVNRPEVAALEAKLPFLSAVPSDASRVKKLLAEYGSQAANSLAIQWIRRRDTNLIEKLLPSLDFPALGSKTAALLMTAIASERPGGDLLTPAQAKLFREKILDDPRLAHWTEARDKWIEVAPRGEKIKLLDRALAAPEDPEAPALLRRLVENWRANGPSHLSDYLEIGEVDYLFQRLRPYSGDPRFSNVMHALIRSCSDECEDKFVKKYLRPGGPPLADEFIHPLITSFARGDAAAEGTKWLVNLAQWMNEQGGIARFPWTLMQIAEGCEPKQINAAVELFLPRLEGDVAAIFADAARRELNVRTDSGRFSPKAARVIADALRAGLRRGEPEWRKYEETLVAALPPSLKEEFFPKSGCETKFAEVSR